VGSDIGEQRRAEVARRAKHRCEYCLIHEDDVGFRHQIDHIVSRKHGGLLISTTWHMPVFIAIAEKGVISLQSMPGRATWSGCFIPAATGGAIISVSVLGSSSR